MTKGKKPRRGTTPDEGKGSGRDAEIERQTQEQAELVAPSAPRRPALFQLVQGVRAVVGALLDLADATAAAITKELQRGR